MKNRVFRVRVADAVVKPLRNGRGVSRLLLHPTTTGSDAIDLHLNELEPNSGPGPRHYHRYAHNVYWVLEGSIHVGLTEEVVVLTSDEVLLIPPGVVHETSNPGPGIARFIEGYLPAGEDFHVVSG